MKKPRILLADDHPEMLSAICGVLEDKFGEVVGVVADGEALVEAAQRLKPDIIITDISMPKLNGLDATRVLHTSVPDSKVIILSVHREPVYVSLAFNAGACAYLLKRTGLHTELPKALQRVIAGDRYIGLGIREECALSDGAEV
ncbi:MAG: response regulator transcription factor [Nitrospira sp. CG24A]|nr:MAG: response regulator transcription factor [Nitrospira sp. CG24A]